MIKIAISGIGGVGGFYGGLLSAHYQGSQSVEVDFISRGKNMSKIAESGLRLETTNGNFTARPKIITDNPAEIGHVDMLIVATKSYDLEENMHQLAPCIGKGTIILSLLNGVDNVDRIKAIYPDNEVWGGVVFIVTRLAEPGLIRETGSIARLKFGTPAGITVSQRKFNDIFREAGIDSVMSEDIDAVLWEKYVWISTVATATSFFDKSLGRILENDEERSEMFRLMAEVIAISKAKRINLPADIAEATIASMKKLPYDMTTSMHSDFLAHKRTEVESLTGLVVKLGKQLGVPTPTYDRMYTRLKERK